MPGRADADACPVDQNVECLRCGTVRSIGAVIEESGGQGECPHCGYLGWAAPSALTESERRVMRLRPPERRRLYAV